MQVVQSVSGKFHHFHLARQLHRQGMLKAIFSSYPRKKLAGEGLPPEKIRTFPAVHLLYLASLRLGLSRPELLWPVGRWDRRSFDRHVAQFLPDCDAFVGISGSALQTGLLAQRRGTRYVCDRGSTHIRFQDQILRDEYQRWGYAFEGVDPCVIADEEAEYAAADAITVPSQFVRRTFLDMGVPAGKVAVIPYGSDLKRFQKVADPAVDSFDVLFVGQVSLRKGIPYLLDAFARLQHPKKTLTLVGAVQPEMRQYLAEKAPDHVTVAGIQPHDRLKELMSRSHVMVLPSLEEGLALVQGEAMACGCPLIATENAGAEDLFEDGAEGFILPPRDPGAIADRLERLAQDPALREAMSARALQRVAGLGGWDTYGNQYAGLLESLPLF